LTHALPSPYFLLSFSLLSVAAQAQVVDTLETSLIGHLGIGGYIAPVFRTRYLLDFFWIYKPKKSRWDAIASAYAGWQQMSGENTRQWWQASIIGRYTINSTVSISGRVEYFHDPQLVFIAPITGISGFRT
jgi:hypothetical protein